MASRPQPRRDRHIVRPEVTALARVRRAPGDPRPTPGGSRPAGYRAAQQSATGMHPVRQGNGTGTTGVATRQSTPATDQAGVGRRPGGAGGSGQARLQEVARGSTLNLVGAGVAAVTTLGLTVLVTRQFSRPVAGAFFTAISAFLIVEAVASLGANVGLVYFIARLRSLGGERRIPTIMRAAVIPVIVASVILTAVLVLLAGPLAHVLLSGRLARGSAGPDAVAQALRALAVTLPFAALLDTFLGASRGYRDMRPTVIVDRIGRSTTQLLGILIAAVTG